MKNSGKRKRRNRSLVALIVLTPISWGVLVQMQNTHAFASTGNWVDITNGGSFNNPFGVAVDNADNLFVTNSGNDTIEERQSGSTTWTDITHGGSLNGPTGIAVDSAGDLFVANNDNNTIEERNSGSTKWTAITNGGSFNHPFGIAVDSAGDLFVANFGNNTIEERQSGSKTWTDITHGGTFNNPTGIAVDSAGDLFVTNYGNSTVEERQSGSKTWTNIANGGSFYMPYGVSTDSAGDVFVVNLFTSTIEERQSGSATWTDVTNGASFSLPAGIAVDSAGDEFVTDLNNTIEEYALAPNAPAKPSHSKVVQTGWTESWTSVSGATGYNVYVNGTKVTGSPVSTTSYSVTGEAAATNYTVKVTAVNAGGESGYSVTDTLTTLPNAPNVPTGLSHSNVTQTGWTESWSAVSGATSYNVYVNGTRSNMNPVLGTSYSLMGEAANTPYTVKVDAVNAGGKSAQSAADSVRTLAALFVSTKSTLPNILEGTNYQQALQATGGLAPYVFTLTSGSLPKGLTLQKDGTLSGTPQTSGMDSFTVKVTDKNGFATTKKMSLYVIPTAPTGYLKTVETMQVMGGSGGTLNTKDGDTTATLTVPSGTFTELLQMDITSGTVANTLMPRGWTVVGAYGVNFDTRYAPSKPMSLTLLNQDITPQSKVYKIVNGKLIPVTAYVTKGKALVTFTTDPDFVVLQPKPVPQATKPVTGLPVFPWVAGGLLSTLTGGLAIWWQRRRKHLE